MVSGKRVPTADSGMKAAPTWSNGFLPRRPAGDPYFRRRRSPFYPEAEEVEVEINPRTSGSMSSVHWSRWTKCEHHRFRGAITYLPTGIAAVKMRNHSTRTEKAMKILRARLPDKIQREQAGEAFLVKGAVRWVPRKV